MPICLPTTTASVHRLNRWRSASMHDACRLMTHRPTIHRILAGIIAVFFLSAVCRAQFRHSCIILPCSHRISQLLIELDSQQVQWALHMHARSKRKQRTTTKITPEVGDLVPERRLSSGFHRTESRSEPLEECNIELGKIYGHLAFMSPNEQAIAKQRMFSSLEIKAENWLQERQKSFTALSLFQACSL